MKNRINLIILFTNLIFEIIIISGCIQHVIKSKSHSQTQFYIRYYYTAEFTYQNVEINQTKLSYTYFPGVSKGKNDNLIASVPHWTEKDLVKKEIILSENEINNLINLIKQTNFMNLESSYGGAKPNQRYYPYQLTVMIDDRKKEVVYQSFTGSSLMP